MGYPPQGTSFDPGKVWAYSSRYNSQRYNVLYEDYARALIRYSATRNIFKNNKYYIKIRETGYGLLLYKMTGLTVLASPNWGTETVNTAPSSGSASSWKDINDSTSASWSLPNATQTNVLVTWDFGSQKPKFIYFNVTTSNCGYGIDGSNDGSTWTSLSTATLLTGTQTKSGWLFANYRYFRFTGLSTSGYTGTVYLYSIEFYDPQISASSSEASTIITNTADYNGGTLIFLNDGNSLEYALLVEYLGDLIP